MFATSFLLPKNVIYLTDFSELSTVVFFFNCFLFLILVLRLFIHLINKN